MHSNFKTSFFLLFLGQITLFCLISAPSVSANTDFKYLDSRGNEIEFPSHLPVYSMDNPGPFREIADILEPKIRMWKREDGLEDIRVMIYQVENPFTQEGDSYYPFEAFYLRDKDDLLISYGSPSEDDVGSFQKKVFFNGIISYVEIFSQYKNIGLWKTELPIQIQDA